MTTISIYPPQVVQMTIFMRWMAMVLVTRVHLLWANFTRTAGRLMM